MSGLGGRTRSPGHPAVICGNRSLSFGELENLQCRLAAFMEAASIGAGDRVAVLARNSIELLVVTVGCLRAGIVPVPISPLLTEPERAHPLEDSGAGMLLADRADEPPVERTVTGRARPDRRTKAGRARPYRSVILMEDLVEELRGYEPAALPDVTLTRPMHYTSGTTGRPKGVWVPLVDETAARARSEAFRALWGMTEADVHLVCSPLTHSGPHRYALRTLEAGGSVVIQERFDAAATLAAIEHHRVTSTFMVPTHLERILALGPDELRAHNLSSLRLLAHAGAPIRRVTKERAMELFPTGSVWEFYGSTEGGFTRLAPSEAIDHPGSVGRSAGGTTIEIRDVDSGRRLDSGEIGIVWLRDPGADRFEYWGDEALTETAWDGDAFTVGDLGRLDDVGYLHLVGRPGELIISGGINVYPREVEDALVGHPEVSEALVYGADDDEWGQQVSALIVAASDDPPDPRAIRAWLKGRLAPHKCPRVIEVVTELPRTTTGKLKRTGLRGQVDTPIALL
ncbi:MAG: class I adenylate-forming enzyme family protein [Actinomycetota bacterium]